MSLDIDLIHTPMKEIRCPHCGGEIAVASKEECVFDGNITHNLNVMADKAGIYQALWRPEELGATRADGLVALLRKGLQDLLERPEHYRQWNPENGWGSYEVLVKFTQDYLQVCEQYPQAVIRVSR